MPAVDLFAVSSDRQFVLLKARPITSAVDEAQLRQLLADSAFRLYKVNDAGLREAVEALNETLTHPESKAALGSSKIVLAQRLDAQLTIEVAEDGMSAEATLVAAYGGRCLSRTDLTQAIQDAGIRRGVDETVLDSLVSTLAKAPPGKRINWLLAQGLAPVKGRDTRFIPKVATSRAMMPQQVEGSADRVDLRNLGAITTVDVGQLLMVRQPFTLGTPGFLVTGEELPAEPGKDAQFSPGKGTQIDPNDPNQLLATQKGMPIAQERGMQVDEVLVIKTVDTRYGHVNFSGSVVISGNVCEGMRVKAGGDINVAGFVESASLEAGGDIVVGRGIIGHQQGGHQPSSSCVVRARGTIGAKFVQYAKLESDTDVLVESQLLHSQVTVLGSVRVQDPGGRKGTLVGGRIQAGEQIEAVILGAQADNSTELVIEGIFGALKKQQKGIQMQLANTQDVIKQVEEAHSKLVLMPAGSKKEELAAKLAATLEHHQAQLAEHEVRLAGNKSQQEAFLAEARILARQKLFSGLRLEIAGKKLTTLRDGGPSQIQCIDGKLEINPL